MKQDTQNGMKFKCKGRLDKHRWNNDKILI